MKRLLLGVMLVTGCTGEVPSGPVAQSIASSPIRVDHSAFSTLVGGYPIAHAATYFYASSPTIPLGDGVATVSLPAGTPINSLTARFYLDTAGTTAGGGFSRAVEMVLVRLEYGPCPVRQPDGTIDPNPQTNCPKAWLTAQTPSAPHGWSVKTGPQGNGAVEVGFTYRLIVNLREAVTPNQRVRVEYVDVNHGVSSAPMVVQVMDRATNRRLTNLATRYVMP